MLARLDALSKTEQQNEAMGRELLELRPALATTPVGDLYTNGIQHVGPGERAALGAHQLEEFPVWAAGLLHLCTFGLFSLIFYGIQQGRMPRAAANDPDDRTGHRLSVHSLLQSLLDVLQPLAAVRFASRCNIVCADSVTRRRAEWCWRRRSSR